MVHTYTKKQTNKIRSTWYSSVSGHRALLLLFVCLSFANWQDTLPASCCQLTSEWTAAVSSRPLARRVKIWSQECVTYGRGFEIMPPHSLRSRLEKQTCLPNCNLVVAYTWPHIFFPVVCMHSQFILPFFLTLCITWCYFDFSATVSLLTPAPPLWSSTCKRFIYFLRLHANISSYDPGAAFPRPLWQFILRRGTTTHCVSLVIISFLFFSDLWPLKYFKTALGLKRHLLPNRITGYSAPPTMEAYCTL